MRDKMKRQIEMFEADYDKIASKEVWDPSDITKMKDLQKLMYYLEVRCAMKDGNDYPGSEHMSRGYDGRSYGRMPYGRNYYDSERRDAIDRLHRMMDEENNQEVKMALHEVIRGMEDR